MNGLKLKIHVVYVSDSLGHNINVISNLEEERKETCM